MSRSTEATLAWSLGLLNCPRLGTGQTEPQPILTTGQAEAQPILFPYNVDATSLHSKFLKSFWRKKDLHSKFKENWNICCIIEPTLREKQRSELKFSRADLKPIWAWALLDKLKLPRWVWIWLTSDQRQLCLACFQPLSCWIAPSSLGS